MNTETKNAVVASDGAAQYDQHAKRLLGQKNVLAYILTKTIDEFKGMKPEDLLNIVLIGVTNELPEHDERYELHRLIGALLSDRLEESEKLDILEQEYHIPLSEDLRKGVNVMCNLSQGIIDNAVKDTIKNIVLRMYDKDFTLEQIALATDKTVEEVKEILEKEQQLTV